jgi:hypothetical protein
MTTALPHGVRELLQSRIDSFEKLELVNALHGAPRATMSLEQLATQLRTTQAAVRNAATELRAAALVEVTSAGEVQLIPPTSREVAALDDLIKCYREDQFAVVKALGEISLARIRNMAAHAFADAFVLRKKTGRRDDDG